MATTFSSSHLKKLYTARPKEAKKYDYGTILVIGGSEFYTGAPALTGLAAFRAGVDMVRVIAPRRAADIIASFSPILAAYGVAGDYITREHVATLLARTEAGKEIAHGNIAVAIGGGIGRTEETQASIVSYLSQIDVPVVIDADAIYAIAGTPSVLSGKPFVVTPNQYEFMILTGRKVRELTLDQRIRAVEEEAKRLQTTIVLKGHVDIASNGTETITNEAGTPYLTGGGTGDTLTGIVAALLARQTDPVVAGIAGAYINGSAGELAAKEKRESLVATDLLETISEVIR